jgi:16S rRNA G966 N2-methylase RsmD
MITNNYNLFVNYIYTMDDVNKVIIDDYYKNKDISHYNMHNIISLIKNNKIEFPYNKKYLLTKKEIIEKFNLLKTFEPNFVKGVKYDIPLYKDNEFLKKYDFKYEDNYELLVMGKGEYSKYNIISDYYNEVCRMKCKRYDKEYSPIDLWNLKTSQVLYDCLQINKSITYKKLRDYFYKYECSNFPSTVLVSIIKKYNSKHILDFSAGWGDRLIAGMACGVKSYCGIDPNSCLHPNYKKMIKLFNYANTNITLIENPFETAKNIPNEPYDLIFTSPPYFLLEEYSKDPEQSINQYNNIDQWFTKFLLFSLEKAWSYLQVGGYMIINIDNIREYPDYVGRMLEERSKELIDKLLTVSTYVGVISFVRIYQNKYVAPRPMWIWRKELLIDKINKPFVIEKIMINPDKTLNIIRDDYVIGGTLMRGFLYFFDKSIVDVYYYIGKNNNIINYLNYVLNLLDKKVCIYTKSKKISGVNIIYGDVTINELTNKCLDDMKFMNKIGEQNMLINNMINDDKNISYLVKSIQNIWKLQDNINIWLMYNDILIKSLTLAIPNATFYVIHKNVNNKYENKNIKYIEHTDNSINNIEPPYKTNKKNQILWQYVVSMGKDGDYVLNNIC